MKPTGITIKRSHIGSDSTVAAFPGWISNGHWAIRRALVANHAQFSTEDVIRASFAKVDRIRVNETDDHMNCILGPLTDKPDAVQAFTVTPWTYESAATGKRFAVVTCGAEHLYLDRMYLNLLNVESDRTVYAIPSGGPFVDDADQPSWICMPAIIDRTGAHLKPLISLVHLLDLEADKVKAS